MNATLRLAAIVVGILSALAAAAAGGDADRRMADAGLVDVAAMDSTIVVDLIYATADNFVGEVMYVDGPTHAWLHPLAADALVKASAHLRKTHPGLRLKITDASRPMSAQRRMYRTVRGTSKAPYVSNPANGGGLHNYGMAVDVTLVDASGRELPMGTPVDHLGPEANITREEALVASGTITRQELDNRLILRKAMQAGGFKPLASEWWHFNLVSRPVARKRYRLLDF